MTALVLAVVAACSAPGGDGADGGPQKAPERQEARCSAPPQQAARRSAPPRVYPMESLGAFDTSDERVLVGFADNVFVGCVKERVGEEPLTSKVVPDPTGPEGPAPSIPQTQFSVEVLENVEGRLNGAVTVSQTGGPVPGENAVVLENGDPLLQPGETVLFATRLDQGRGWHQVAAANHGDVRLETPEERKRVVELFEEATKNPIDPIPGRP